MSQSNFKNIRKFDCPELEDFEKKSELKEFVENMCDFFNAHQWSFSYTEQGYLGFGLFHKRAHLLSINLGKNTINNKSNNRVKTSDIRDQIREHEETLKAFLEHTRKLTNNTNETTLANM
ncbi:hypothetical protein HDV00_000271 [Rhizophlyctis rosea]|nr:hypothetical protein HDV00_000271 [Rhizophlyctis rosea]